MRTLFIAVSRVFGLLQVYYGLAYITSMVPALAMIRRTTRGDVGEVFARSFSGAPVVLATGGMVATLVLTFGVAWLLLVRTDWLADKLALPELDAQPPLSPDSILHVGARLLGLYVVIQTGPVLVGQLGTTISEIRQIVGLSDSIGVGRMERMFIGRIWSGFAAPGLKLALGLLLVFKTDSVMKWIDTTTRENASNK
jgi:hypothetical protein